MTTAEIQDQIASARGRLATTDIPADWLAAVFDGVTVRQQTTPRGSWLVEWPFAAQRMLLPADTDAAEVERVVITALDRTARNWEDPS